MMVYKDSTTTSVSPTQHSLLSIGDAVSTGGLWLYYDVSSGKLELVVTNNTTALNSAGSALQSTATTMFADNTWQFVGLKEGRYIYWICQWYSGIYWYYCKYKSWKQRFVDWSDFW